MKCCEPDWSKLCKKSVAMPHFTFGRKQLLQNKKKLFALNNKKIQGSHGIPNFNFETFSTTFPNNN